MALVDRKIFQDLIDNGTLQKVRIAEIVGVSRQAISKWTEIPARYVTEIHNATGIPKAALRPSDFA